MYFLTLKRTIRIIYGNTKEEKNLHSNNFTPKRMNHLQERYSTQTCIQKFVDNNAE